MSKCRKLSTIHELIKDDYRWGWSQQKSNRRDNQLVYKMPVDSELFDEEKLRISLPLSVKAWLNFCKRR
ncbi:hypothetical protein, partial [Enterococcus hirae]|uniref:hypothetical protein n=1 Tax=Enterococcus hirae TaxID=1354 RepID=UPI001F23B78D